MVRAQRGGCVKILHVTPSFYPAHYYGGPTASVFALCQRLRHLGNEVRVLTTNANGPSVVNDGGEELLDGIPVRYCARWLQPDLAPALLSSLPGLVRWADVVHVTGVFSYSTPPALLSALMLERPVVSVAQGLPAALGHEAARTPEARLAVRAEERGP